MKNSKCLVMLFACSCIIQRIYFYKLDMPSFAFCVGLTKDVADTSRTHSPISYLMLAVPIVFALFICGNRVAELTDGYGKLIIVRQYSKSKLILKEILLLFLKCNLLTAYQIFIYSINWGNQREDLSENILKSIFGYILSLFLLSTIEFGLELYMKPHFASIALAIPLVACNYYVYSFPFNHIMRFILFPCLMFGSNNSAYTDEAHYVTSLCVICLISIVASAVVVYKFNHQDIY